jgi:hypothetical protein
MSVWRSSGLAAQRLYLMSRGEGAEHCHQSRLGPPCGNAEPHGPLFAATEADGASTRPFRIAGRSRTDFTNPGMRLRVELAPA